METVPNLKERQRIHIIAGNIKLTKILAGNEKKFQELKDLFNKLLELIDLCFNYSYIHFRKVLTSESNF